jgi:hypothetical protein
MNEDYETLGEPLPRQIALGNRWTYERDELTHRVAGRRVPLETVPNGSGWLSLTYAGVAIAGTTAVLVSERSQQVAGELPAASVNAALEALVGQEIFECVEIPGVEYFDSVPLLVVAAQTPAGV